MRGLFYPSSASVEEPKKQAENFADCISPVLQSWRNVLHQIAQGLQRFTHPAHTLYPHVIHRHDWLHYPPYRFILYPQRRKTLHVGFWRKYQAQLKAETQAPISAFLAAFRETFPCFVPRYMAAGSGVLSRRQTTSARERLASQAYSCSVPKSLYPAYRGVRVTAVYGPTRAPPCSRPPRLSVP
jgi:hypothetical protein